MRSMMRRLTMPRHRPFLLVGLLVAGLYLGGWLDKVERDLTDLRARLHTRPASGELLVVAIDPASLQALSAAWPWPRRYHAEVLSRLLEAGAGRVAFDIDFSSPSTPEDDRALEEVLAAAGPERVALAVHRQRVRDQIFDTAPLPGFRPHVSLASITVARTRRAGSAGCRRSRPGATGPCRRCRPGWPARRALRPGTC